jgi:hypothetical protein
VQPAEASNPLMPRAQIQMISIAEKDLRANVFQCILRDSLHRPGRSHRHKDRRLNRTMRQMHSAASSRARGGMSVEGERHCIDCMCTKLSRSPYTLSHLINVILSEAKDLAACCRTQIFSSLRRTTFRLHRMPTRTRQAQNSSLKPN